MASSRPLSAALLLAASPFVCAQVQPAERIMRVVDRNVTVKLTGNRHPLARPEFERGAVAPEEPIERMMLVLTADPATQAELVNSRRRSKTLPRRNIINGSHRKNMGTGSAWRRAT